MTVKAPRAFFAPLAAGAPQPFRDLPQRLERVIHFIPPHLQRPRDKTLAAAAGIDVVCANLEDAIPADAKTAAREGAILMAGQEVFASGRSQLWARINGPATPWHLDDVMGLMAGCGEALTTLMIPKVEGPWDIHYMDQLLSGLEARHGRRAPVLLHAILETAQGVANVEAIATASPRLAGMSLGPADLAASRAMKTTRVGGGHPAYRVLSDPNADGSPRESVQQDIWHYTLARMVDACAAVGIKPFYGPFGDIADDEACEQQFSNAFLLGCAGAWSLHPGQIPIAQRVFSPDPAEVAFALRILEAMPDGAGVAMINGRMQDDATWKQAKVLVDLAKTVVAREPERAAEYGF
jgi:malyl-CoA/(S)-citramalyl-CoA lyase